MNILKVSEERWKAAQKDELQYWASSQPDGDDWNGWWQEQFENYKFLYRAWQPMLEVGCGPFANNARRIAALFPDLQFNIHLLDPLMTEFIARKTAVTEIPGAWLRTGTLEDLDICEHFTFGVIACINVLDHVQDVARCFRSMDRHLDKGGMLIIGQDLSNEIDYAQCPESWTDTMHPIKMDLESLAPFIFPHYQTQFLRILSRDKGRNPKAHYATLLFAGTKL